MGRRRRITTYQSAAEKRVKNIHTRRTKAAIIHRDIAKGRSKRLKQG